MFDFLHSRCPVVNVVSAAVTNPIKYCVLPPGQAIPPEKQTSLVYIAKVLTSLCNGVYYGQKEQYMMPMNGFLRSQEDNMRTFLEFVSEVRACAAGARTMRVWQKTTRGGREQRLGRGRRCAGKDV